MNKIRLNQILDDGNDFDVAYHGYMKAFDNVFCWRLIHKLKICKIGEVVSKLDWILLAGREQNMIVNDRESNWITVNSGIPQGSVLVPMLFVLIL